jgi:hydroxyacylglutathione hydrolase
MSYRVLNKGVHSFTLDHIMVERVIVGPWKTNCYIYSSSKKECIIIDPGGSEAEIASRVDVLNMVPVGIALTHGHVDHVAALGKLRDSYGARGYRLPVAICPADRRFLGTGGRENHRESLEFLGLDEQSFFGMGPDELPKADVRLKEGDRVFDMDIVVMETPGHTPGSVCFYAEKEGILFSGDTLFFDGVGRCDLPGGSEKKLRESILKKIAVLPPETRVFPGHGPFTTVEREKRGNAWFRDALLPARPPIVALGRPMPVPPPQPVTADLHSRPTTAVRPAPSAPAAAPAARRKVKAVVRRPKPTKSGKAKKPGKAAAKKRSPVRKKTAVVKRPGSKIRTSKKNLKLKKVTRAPAAAKARSLKPPAKKTAQATRSTKAPGSGKKAAR